MLQLPDCVSQNFFVPLLAPSNLTISNQNKNLIFIMFRFYFTARTSGILIDYPFFLCFQISESEEDLMNRKSDKREYMALMSELTALDRCILPEEMDLMPDEWIQVCTKRIPKARGKAWFAICESFSLLGDNWNILAETVAHIKQLEKFKKVAELCNSFQVVRFKHVFLTTVIFERHSDLFCCVTSAPVDYVFNFPSDSFSVRYN